MKLELLASTAPMIGATVCLTPSSALAQEPVAEFQAFLAGRGCDVGSADGQWGRRTQAAADAFAAEAGIPIARPITAELLAALAATDAQCPAPVLFNVEETLSPEAYWKFWQNTNNCNPDVSPRRSGPQEAHKDVSLPDTLPEDFAWALEMPAELALECAPSGGGLGGYPSLDAHELDLNYGEEFPADAFARNLSRAMPGCPSRTRD